MELAHLTQPLHGDFQDFLSLPAGFSAQSHWIPFKTSSVGSYCCVRATIGACEHVVGVPSESGDERRLKVKCWVSRDEFAVLGKERELGLKTEMPLSTL